MFPEDFFSSQAMFLKFHLFSFNFIPGSFVDFHFMAIYTFYTVVP